MAINHAIRSTPIPDSAIIFSLLVAPWALFALGVSNSVVVAWAIPSYFLAHVAGTLGGMVGLDGTGVGSFVFAVAVLVAVAVALGVLTYAVRRAVGSRR